MILLNLRSDLILLYTMPIQKNTDKSKIQIQVSEGENC